MRNFVDKIEGRRVGKISKRSNQNGEGAKCDKIDLKPPLLDRANFA